jgi:hypothetical protein
MRTNSPAATLTSTLPRLPAALAAAVAFSLLAASAPGRLQAADALRIGHGEGRAGAQGVEVIVTASNDRPIHGYSVALSFPQDALVLRSIGVGGTHVSALLPEFVGARVDNGLGIATLGVIIDFSEPIVPNQLPATFDSQNGGDKAPHIVARLVFDVLPQAAGGIYPLRLIDGVGSPAVHNRFTFEGQSIQPALEDGSFLIEGGNVLSLEQKLAIAGAAPNLSVMASVLHPDPLDGFSIAIAYDCSPGSIAFKESGFAATDLGFILGNRIEFFTSGASDDFPCRVETAILFDYNPPIDGSLVLPAATGTPQTVMRYVFSVGAQADDGKQYQDLTLDNRDDPVATNNLFFIGSRSVPPRVVHGKIYFSTGDLAGRVVDALSGEPVAGVAVELSPRPCPQELQACVNPVLTNVRGEFLFSGIIPGIYQIKLSKREYYSSLSSGIEVAGRNERTNAGDLRIYKVPPTVDPGGTSGRFSRGDSNNDRRVDISDAIHSLNFLFQGSAGPLCEQAADANNDNRIDISDSVWTLNFIFNGGDPIPPPADCGTDPDNGPLPCERSSCP